MKSFQPKYFHIFVVEFLGLVSGTCFLERIVSTVRGLLSRNGFYSWRILGNRRWCLGKNGCSIPFLLIKVFLWLRWLASILMVLSLNYFLIGFSILAFRDEHIDFLKKGWASVVQILNAIAYFKLYLFQLCQQLKDHTLKLSFLIFQYI